MPPPRSKLRSDFLIPGCSNAPKKSTSRCHDTAPIIPIYLTVNTTKNNKGSPKINTLGDIPQMTSKFREIVPPFHRQENCIPYPFGSHPMA